MKCPRCESNLKEIHSELIANVEYENITKCTNIDCDYAIEMNCGAIREHYDGKYYLGG